MLHGKKNGNSIH